uniref:Signal peptidase complex subunit 3 n=1 Tax=Albugo laibachii Nc14 TaxID=890382 RepID=F0W003_9STRA|nr:signal peptidase complex subunit 3 putative [Albugo laibachii Nc14]|eukprot:CCA14374.1 signal peptidase complex subunit 3 putative [Albugo laibachii Nc14]
MYSVWTRANALFFMSLTVLGILVALTAITTIIHVDKVAVDKLEMSSFHSLRKYRDKTDRATIAFDLKADLSSIFNWNVKQIFLYIIAEFETPQNKLNEVVIWDWIIGKKEDADLDYDDEMVKYFLASQYDDLRGANVTLRLEWDVMPVCGRLYKGSYHSPKGSFLLPDLYQGSAADMN